MNALCTFSLIFMPGQHCFLICRMTMHVILTPPLPLPPPLHRFSMVAHEGQAVFVNESYFKSEFHFFSFLFQTYFESVFVFYYSVILFSKFT